MTNDHSITLSPELKQEWFNEAPHQDYCSTTDYVIDKAAQWGYEQRGADIEDELQKARDEELDACCEWLKFYYPHVHTNILKLIRRPKLKRSLKEQALAVLDDASNQIDAAHENIIRRALEQLDD